MKLFCGVGVLGSIVLAGLTGCSGAAREASSNDVPSVQQITLTTATSPAYVGALLRGSYQYTDPNNDSESGTVKVWLRDGQPIEGANQDSYTATAQDSGKTLQYRVTPAAATGESPGVAGVSSGIVIENSAPVITISKPLVDAADIYTTGIGSMLRVDYSYSDADGDEAAPVEIQWLRGGNPISGATTSTYTVTPADMDFPLVAEVTPIARGGVLRGEAVTSASVQVVNSEPAAQKLVITPSATPVIVGVTLTASYNYVDADTDREHTSGSLIQWWRNGAPINAATALSYPLTVADADARIHFTVRPKADSGNSPGDRAASTPLIVVNSKPVASNVIVSGGSGAVVGTMLTGSYNYSDLDLNPKGASVYRWFRGASVIPGATASKYTAVAADSGNDLVFEVTPVATGGASPGLAVRSFPAIRVNNSAPVAQKVTLSANTTPPANTTPGVGSVLTGSYAYFDADGDTQGTSTFRWLRNGVEITGAQGQTYTLVAADVVAGAITAITFEVTPSAARGILKGSATLSNSLAVANLAPTVTGVAITPSTAQVTTKLTATYIYGDVNRDAEGANLYEWYNGGMTVIGRAKDYIVAATDAHKTLTVKVTPVALTGTSPGIGVTSPGVTIGNSPPSITGVVINGLVKGQAYSGLQLTASYSFQDADGDIEGSSVYQWLRDGVAIANATLRTYLVSSLDVGKALTVQVTPKDSLALAGPPMTSPAIIPVNLAPVASDVVILGKTPNKAGEILSVSYLYTDNEGDGEPATGSQYRWFRNGVAITGATGRTYTLTLLDAGKTMSAEVTPLALTGTRSGLPVVSNAVAVAPANVALTVSPALKHLSFKWAAVAGATSYRLSYNPNGVSGFVLLSAATNNLTTTAYDWDIAVHRINWPKAQFMLEACASNICLPSASISALNVMVNTIGYFKASNAGQADNFGVAVAISGDGNTLAVGAYHEASSRTGINSTPDELSLNAGAVYIYVHSGTTWVQQAYVKASNTAAGANFGRSVALSTNGNTLAVGADGADAVYVYSRDVATWSQQALLKASNTQSNDLFGIAVTLSGDGNTLAVGAHFEGGVKAGVTIGAPDEAAAPNGASKSGAVYVYTRIGIAWTQQTYVKASLPGVDNLFGSAVSLSADGNTLAVGAYAEDSAGINGAQVDGCAAIPVTNCAADSGAVYVFVRNGNFWSQQAYVKASNTGASDLFGSSVSLTTDGNTLAVGAPGEGSNSTGINSVPNELARGAGAAYVFTRSILTWSQQAYVKASNPGASDSFGFAIALSANGTTLAVGAYDEDSAKTGIIPGAPDDAATPDDVNTVTSGAVYVYTRSPTTWAPQAYVKASNTGNGDSFGRAVALSAEGNVLAVGAFSEASAATRVNNTLPGQSDNTAPSAGAVYLY